MAFEVVRKFRVPVARLFATLLRFRINTSHNFAFTKRFRVPVARRWEAKRVFRVLLRTPHIGITPIPFPVPIAPPGGFQAAPYIRAAYLTKPKLRVKMNGSVIRVAPPTISWRVNRGWELNIVLPKSISPRFPLSTIFTVEAEAYGIPFKFPRFRCPQRERAESVMQGKATMLRLMDETTFRLAQRGKNLGTFSGTTSGQMISFLASQAGVSITGYESFNILDEDVNGSNYGDPILRLLAVAGQDAIVQPSGEIVCISVLRGSNRPRPPVSEVVEKLDLTRHYTDVTWMKTSRMADEQCYSFDQVGFQSFQLRNPIFAPEPRDHPSMFGYCDLVAIWTGEPTSTKSKLMSFWNLHGEADDAIVGVPVTPTPGIPATHVTLTVFKPPSLLTETQARICFVGRLDLPQGVDHEFKYRYQIDGDPLSPSEEIEDTLPPSLAWVQAHAPAYLYMLNRGSYDLSFTGPINGEAGLTHFYTFPGFPKCRVEEVTWDFASGTTNYLGRVVDQVIPSE